MKNIKKTLFIAALAIALGANSSSAQIIVKVRPDRPKYVRIGQPSPKHIWIEDDWEPRGKTYVFTGGRWAAPEGDRAVWVPGQWREKKHGYVWVRGHWR